MFATSYLSQCHLIFLLLIVLAASLLILLCTIFILWCFILSWKVFLIIIWALRNVIFLGGSLRSVIVAFFASESAMSLPGMLLLLLLLLLKYYF